MLQCPTCGKQYSAGLNVCPADSSILQADPTMGEGSLTDPLVGQTLDEKYRIEARLGVGGMGTVYRARHVLIDRAVAVKVLNPRYGEDEAARQRFRREAKAAGRVRHANAVAVTDFGETTAGFVYIVMELLEGRTLRDTIAREAPLETARSVSIMLQASAAVAAAHDAGVIHRDLKPANIFLVQRSDVPVLVKVLDFGIAKLAADSAEEEPNPLTQVGAMIGTPRYMSPEQCNGMELTPAADVYSLGVILYEMLTGSAPFSGSTPLAIALKHAADPPRSLREIVAAIPVPIEEVVMHALEKNPVARPPDASAFRRELLETAEKLGLEHSWFTSAADIRTLRDAGNQSPSGRLVIDISRLRETRVNASGTNDITVIRDGKSSVNNASQDGQTGGARESRQSFPRVTVPTAVASKKLPAKYLVPTSVVVGCLLLLGAVLLASRTRSPAPASQNMDAVTAPTPSLEPSPLPTVSPQPKREASKTKLANANANANANKNENANANANKKKRSLFGKIKRIFTP